MTFQPKNEAQFGRALSFHEGMLFIGGETYSYLMMVPENGTFAMPYLVPFWSYFPDFLGTRKNMIASVISRSQLVAKYENDISTAVYCKSDLNNAFTGKFSVQIPRYYYLHFLKLKSH